VLRLTGRYYRTLPPTAPGYETESLELEPDRTALVSLHCWDIGCPGGSRFDERFCVGMGYPDVTRRAYTIMTTMIRPALIAARASGLQVCHVQAEQIARRYPEWFTYAVDEPSEDPIPQPQVSGEAIPGYRKKILERAHGPDYSEASALAEMDFPAAVAPEPGEPIVHQTSQFDRILRERGIVNLIYAGFATDMCILNAPGGMGPMFGLGYRVILMRDATIGVEPPDFLDNHIATRWAIRYHEAHWGDTITTADFIAACEAAG